MPPGLHRAATVPLAAAARLTCTGEATPMPISRSLWWFARSKALPRWSMWMPSRPSTVSTCCFSGLTTWRWRGMAMDQPRPEGCFEADLAAVAAAAHRHGKIAGGVFGSVAALRHAIGLGYRLVVCTADVVLLAVNSQAAARACRTVLDEGTHGDAADAASS